MVTYKLDLLRSKELHWNRLEGKGWYEVEDWYWRLEVGMHCTCVLYFPFSIWSVLVNLFVFIFIFIMLL